MEGLEGVVEYLKGVEVIDSHVHVINIDLLNYDVVEFKTSPDLAKNWLEDSYLADLGPIPIHKLIFEEVNASKDSMLKEVQWVHETMVLDPSSKFIGIVANVPIEDGPEAVREWLDTLKAYPSVCGIRRLIQDRPTGFCTTPNFLSGIQEVAQRGLPFDICIRAGAHPQQMADVLQLVQQVPQITFILDHIGKPGIAQESTLPGSSFPQWAQFISQLASYPNTYCKVSGVITEARKDWSISDVRPWILVCFEKFGFERCLFGSDWFICTLNGSLGRWIQVLCTLLEECKATLDQKIAFFGKTAQKIYKITSSKALTPST
eukprot:TRINITY_DN12650_c0_g2_i1.p1 TRINITY_DN12650_c0_g2~~TRINITY_DN12650_c0_g2_i1.p1  ORF type:complete len:319 (+),score=83.24 TRINITY_DN12650_c0_g2_i1:40-996(+)